MAGQSPNMEQFEAYFQRADVDRDGRISGNEAVAFLQASNLPRQVLAQIWMYADQNRTGFLGRSEFYNALKLVTVAQSKRDLTPELVKAALYGPASAKIPAPQINLAALPAPQPNVRAGASSVQVSGLPSSTQTTGGVGLHGSLTQQSQITRPPRPPPPSSGFQSQLGVSTQGMPATGAIPASNRPNSFDSLGGSTHGQSGISSQVSSRSLTPTATQSGFGPVTSPITKAPEITGSLQFASSKLNDTASLSSQVSKEDSKSPSATGNGFTSDSVFGDVFSATPPQPQQISTALMNPAGSIPASSAGNLTNSREQPTVKPSAVSQPPAAQAQQYHSHAKANQHVSAQKSSALPVAAGQSQSPWPRMTQSDLQKYSKVFVQVDTDRDGKITGEQARNLFLSWRLPREVLKQVWDLSDQDNDSMLSLREFCIALYLMERYREGRPLPVSLPNAVMFDETLFPVSSQPAGAYVNTSWRPTPGQPQGTKGVRPVASAGGGRPPRPVPIPQTDEPVQQKAKVPVLEKHLVDQLSTEEQDSLNKKFEEAKDAEKKAESLAKKYEEKYKQVGDVASKLTIEEATFRDIQDRVNQIQSDIEELVKSLNERCKTYGLRGKPTTLVELPFGFSYVKELTLDVENVIAPPKPKTALIREKVTSLDNSSTIKSHSKTDKSVLPGSGETIPDNDRPDNHNLEQTARSPPDSPAGNNAVMRPSKDINLNGSPHAFDTQSEYGAESVLSGDKVFDEPGWGTFDTHYDSDAAWDFNSANQKDSEPERHSEASLFSPDDWGLNPIKTGSKGTETALPKQGPFFDSVPSTPLYNSATPNADNLFMRNSPFAFADSVPSTPMYNSSNSPRFGEGSEEPYSFDSFSRFDSFNMRDSGPFSSRESFTRFDSMRSTRDSEFDQGYLAPRESLSRFDSFRSTADSDYNFGLFPPRETLTRFDSMRSTRDSIDYGHGFPSFDDAADPFGSGEPFKTSHEAQTPRKDSDSWKAF
ncbi:EH domain-containing protein 2 [Sesamum angolense]|uniref:EH domain-containing protein 2 n=1 Tax=Sesamum angolense TaxID=2727404 RepID=A0AAE1XCQ2_9LAMI|nr:EH domain-containing protein 2 [Sesamum angolense]